MYIPKATRSQELLIQNSYDEDEGNKKLIKKCTCKAIVKVRL